MVLTRAQEQRFSRWEEAIEQRFSRWEEKSDQRFSRLEEMIAALGVSRKQTQADQRESFTKPQVIQENDDRSPLDRYSPRSQKVESEVATEPIETKHGIVKPEANANVILANLEEEPISQLQVPVSKLEPSLRFHNASPDVCEDFKSLVGFDGLFDHVKARAELVTKSTSVTNNQAAHQLFDKMSLIVQSSKRRQIKCHKSWRFKFKHRVAPRDSKSGFEVKMKQNLSKEYPRWFLASNGTTLVHTLFGGEMKFSGCKMLLQLLLSAIHKKRQRKTPKYHKSWKFRFKNMELQRIMTQLDTQHFIFRGDSECILHLSTVVHHLETSHKQSSLAIDALTDFGVDVIIFHGEQQLECRVVMLHFRNKGRCRRFQSLSRLVLLAWINLWFRKAYKLSGQLQDSSNGEDESFPFLNFAAEQALLWMQNNAERIRIVSKLERKKKKLCYKTWMFKYKAPNLDTKVFETSGKYIRRKGSVGADRETKNNQPTLTFLRSTKQSYLSLRDNRVWDPGGSLVDAATPCLLSLHFTTLHFITAILSFLKTLRSRFLQRREM